MTSKKPLLFSTLILITSLFSNAQEPIDVAESTLKVAGLGEEVFYYGFSEGDKIIFSFEEINGKELKELEIIEYPSSSKFMDYKTKKIENKTLNVTKSGIYKFRFANSAILGRICKFKIQRIPASEIAKNFNTSVYWKKIYDTTFTTVEEKYIVKADTAVVNIVDQVAKVHSVGNLNGSTNTFNFILPKNTVSWSYYVGVNQAGQQAFEEATEQLAKTSSKILLKMPGYGPLAALALGGVSYLSKLQSGEDIDFWIVDPDNIGLFNSNQPFRCYKKGKVLNDFSPMSAPLSGMYYFCLSNDNAITGVSVTVKVTAITVNNVWGVRPVKKYSVASREEPYLKN